MLNDDQRGDQNIVDTYLVEKNVSKGKQSIKQNKNDDIVS